MLRQTAILFATAALCGGANPAQAQKQDANPGQPVGAPAYPAEPAPDVYKLIEDAGSSADRDGADVVVAFDRTETIVEESGLSHVTQRRVFKILTDKGAAQLTSLRFDYDPASKFVALKRAVVYREGKVHRTLGVDQFVDAPQPARSIFWGARMKLLAIGRLDVGDALEVVTYGKGFTYALLTDAPEDDKYIPPMRGHFYAYPVFGDQPFPVMAQHYVVKMAKGKPLQYQVVNGDVRSEATIDGDQVVYHFWKNDMPAFVKEEVAPDASDTLAKVVMATVEDWQAKSRWFYEVNEGQFDANDAIKAKVAEITKGKSEAQAIDALLHWVAQEIRYSGIPMAKGEGYTLHKSTTTFHDRAGVCKDIAGMLVTMLRVANHTVYPAMTMAGSRVEKVPADQFNHCVVALKQKDGSFRMLDPTWAPFSRNTWSNAEREQHYVVGTPEGDVLRMIPAQGAEQNELTLTAATRLAADGTLSGRLTLTGKGYLETRLRRHLIYQPAAQLRNQLIVWLAVLSPHVVLRDYAMTDIRDLVNPFAVQLDFDVPAYATSGDDLIILHMPLARNLVQSKRLGRFLTTAKGDERKSDILFSSTEDRIYRERLKIPRGYRLVGGPIRAKMVTDVADFAASIKEERGHLVLEQRVRIHQRRVAPGKYPDYKKVIDAVRAFAGTTLYLEKISAKGGAK